MPERFTSEILDDEGIRQVCPKQWSRLGKSGQCENPFYGRQHLLAGLNTIDRHSGIRALAIRDPKGELAGLFPFRRRFLLPFSAAQGAANLYQVNGAPLVDADTASEVIEAWLATVRSSRAPKYWVFPNVEIDGPFHRRASFGASRSRMETRVVAPYNRAHLSPGLADIQIHAGQVIGKSRMKDIQRNLRRLKDAGDVSFERAIAPDLVRQRLEQFLAMEQAGWKGAAGTAFLSKPEHAAFARQAYGGEPGYDGLASIDSLMVDGQPVAMSINIASGKTGYTPKVAYDEAWRKFSPGLVLEYLVIERFYASDDFADMDASTTVEDHLLTGLWNGRRTIGTIVVGPAGWRTTVLARQLQAMHDGKQRLKKLLRRGQG